MLKIFRLCIAGLAWGLLGSLAALAAEPESATGYEVQAWNPRKPVPGVQTSDLSGKVWRLAELRGKAVLTINFKESPTKVQQFVQRTGLTLPVLPDPQGSLARAWGVTIFPSTVLIGADGRVRSVLRGELDWTGADAQRLLGREVHLPDCCAPPEN